MSHDLKDPINLPPINWDKVLKWSAGTALFVTVLGLLVRGRSFLIAAQFLDIIIIIGLLVLGVYALIAKYAGKQPPKS